ncbi:MAG: hypothetical protein NTW13_05830 [Candidatus Omnitrophica bacterium]|nr:hypothetical protein [Candidatus Omnitrophota bacterium]
MLSRDIRILDFDASLIKQKKILSSYKHEIINLKDIAPHSRLWMDKKTKAKIMERLSGSQNNSPTFLGSGDFHHISSLLINEFDQPMSVIIFDFHPDWDILPPRFGCGSWVTEILKNKNILKIVLIGVSSDDLSSASIQSGNLKALEGDRLEVYPYQHQPTNVLFRSVPENISLTVKKRFFCNKIYWDELKDKDLQVFFSSMLSRIPTKKVYVSIDKDCLKSKYALTNWEEGLLSLDELLLMLRLIRDNFDIAGLDITGDYSKNFTAGRFKSFISRLDHPRPVKADKIPESVITAINELTNLKILETLYP